MTRKSAPFNNPFGKLSLRQEPQAPAAKAPPAPAPRRAPPRTSADEDAALFLESVGEVNPVRAGKGRAPPPAPPSADQVRLASEEAESLARLAELVSEEGAFELTEAEEGVEGAVQGFDPNVRRRLRAGAFPPQASLDLHGLSRDEARGAVERFVQQARVAGHRCVRVVTGRGLHSPDQVPVLREGVAQWLTRGRTGRQVLAFCPARPQDGGAGAVYVLLRR